MGKGIASVAAENPGLKGSWGKPEARRIIAGLGSLKRAQDPTGKVATSSCHGDPRILDMPGP